MLFISPVGTKHTEVTFGLIEHVFNYKRQTGNDKLAHCLRGFDESRKWWHAIVKCETVLRKAKDPLFSRFVKPTKAISQFAISNGYYMHIFFHLSS